MGSVELYNKNIGCTLGLFSLLVAVKWKPEIVSQGELIVNLRRNCRVRRARQTTIWYHWAILTVTDRIQNPLQNDS